MINNFDEVKKQLSELSEVINKFKSEAVQLRIVEIVLGDGAFPKRVDDHTEKVASRSPKVRRKKSANSKATAKEANTPTEEKPAKKSRPTGQGAIAALSELADGAFFDKPKTINEIVDHCEVKLGRRLISAQPEAD